MSVLKWLLVALTAYGALLVLMALMQRSLMYFPETVRTAPASAGLAEAEEVILDTADGERIVAWHLPPRDGKPVVLHFHGNGGSLRYRVPRFQAIIAQGLGLIALSYRGYAGSSGKPTEAGLIADARAAYDFAVARYPADRLVAWGESLGTGVAVALAAERPLARIVLQAPFTSAVDLAAARYPFIPVRWLMQDQFRSDLRIGAIRVPIMVMHGARDRVIPIAYGERLFGMIRSEKEFVRMPEADHHDLDDNGGLARALAFVDR